MYHYMLNESKCTIVFLLFHLPKHSLKEITLNNILRLRTLFSTCAHSPLWSEVMREMELKKKKETSTMNTMFCININTLQISFKVFYSVSLTLFLTLSSPLSLV